MGAASSAVSTDQHLKYERHFTTQQLKYVLSRNSNPDTVDSLWGYAERNGEAHMFNEDQAAYHVYKYHPNGISQPQSGPTSQPSFDTQDDPDDWVDVVLFGIFDGHAGYDTALYAAKHFPKFIELEHIQHGTVLDWPEFLTHAFLSFDEHLREVNLEGGCAVGIVLFVESKLIVANAGDVRCIASFGGDVSPLDAIVQTSTPEPRAPLAVPRTSFDSNPGSDRPRSGSATSPRSPSRPLAAQIIHHVVYQISVDHRPEKDFERVTQLGLAHPHWLGNVFRVGKLNENLADIDALPSSERKKLPLVMKTSGGVYRLMATIQCVRGFGDFELSVHGANHLRIKPFLTSKPHVAVVDLKQSVTTPWDVLVIGCDGLFDVFPNHEIISFIHSRLRNGETHQLVAQRPDDIEIPLRKRRVEEDKLALHDSERLHRDFSRLWGAVDLNVIARQLVTKAREERRSYDDIACFIIPLFQHT